MRKSAILAMLLLLFACIGANCASAAADSYRFYFGNLHAHTSYSDGMGTPDDAYSQVSTSGEMDFFALTEHGYYFQELTNIHLWYKSIEIAEQFHKEGEFIPLVGYEWTHSEGHMNGYGTPKAASRDTQRDLIAFINYLHEFGGFATFNHPNPEIQPNWNDFSYWSYADEVVSMIEVGSGAYYRNTRNEPSYIKALDRGWKVGAVNNQDNHRDDWGRAAEVRTGLVATELTTGSVLDAMRNMRTYSTEDRNAKVLLSCEGSMMGDTMIFAGSSSGREYELEVYAEDPNEEGFSSIKIITNGGKVAGSISSPIGTIVKFKVRPSIDYNYYYAKLVQDDGDTIITSPVWIETGSGVVASDFRMEDVFVSKGKQATFYTRVADRTGSGDLLLPYRLMADYGEGFVPVAEGNLEIASGRWSHLLIPWVPSDAGKVQLKVVFSTEAGWQEFAAGKYDVLLNEPMKFAVDEGHNNRLTSYYKELISLAKGLGYEGKVNEGLLTEEMLKELKVLILPLAEQGFALTPTYYEEPEIKAVADWVRNGGSLLLTGWGDTGDGTRDPKDFNLLLEELSTGLSFGLGMISSDGKPVQELLITLPSGAYRTGLLEASPILVSKDLADVNLAAWSAVVGAEAILSDGKVADDAVVVAAIEVGKGRLMLLGSVPFSDYELGKQGFGNSALTKAILKWLFEGRW